MRWQILRRHIENGVPLTTLAAHEGIGLRTLQRWHAAHKRDGIAGLSTANRGTTGRRSTPELVALVEGLALVKPPLPITAIARKANRVAADHDWAPLSYSTVRSITTGLDPGMRTLAQQGTAVYRDTYELAWRHRAERPNMIWQADHTELDILVLDANLKPGRPWLTTIMDDYSRAGFPSHPGVGATVRRPPTPDSAPSFWRGMTCAVSPWETLPRGKGSLRTCGFPCRRSDNAGRGPRESHPGPGGRVGSHDRTSTAPRHPCRFPGAAGTCGTTCWGHL
ncbi:helix-turn-helix domain-containing protein [Pseudarthrobacter sp. S9]|uniref:helix-turn-helix domain-containing protein n=1 Tax=Pseudarthrobacter sp. S9 TaxID=3418421 RepID=UPI003D02703E